RTSRCSRRASVSSILHGAKCSPLSPAAERGVMRRRERIAAARAISFLIPRCTDAADEGNDRPTPNILRGRIMKIRQMVAIVAIGLVPVFGAAQSTIDLAGKWVVDQSKMQEID